MRHMSHYMITEYVLIANIARELSCTREAFAAALAPRGPPQVHTPPVSPPPPPPMPEPLLGVPIRSLPPGKHVTLPGHRGEPPVVFIPIDQVIVLVTAGPATPLPNSPRRRPDAEGEPSS